MYDYMPRELTQQRVVQDPRLSMRADRHQRKRSIWHIKSKGPAPQSADEAGRFKRAQYESSILGFLTEIKSLQCHFK